MAFGNGWGQPPMNAPGYGPGMMMQEQMRGRGQSYGGPWQKQIYCVMVDGEQAARNYFVPPGERAILFEKERSIFYIKEVDEYNATSFEAYGYDRIAQEDGAQTQYVTRAELDEILAQLTGAQAVPIREEGQPQQAAQRQMRRVQAREAASNGQPGV